MDELRKQLEKGVIQKAYGALLSYMMALRTHFKNNLAGAKVSGLYQGYMDMTYFALFPSSFKHHNLKITNCSYGPKPTKWRGLSFSLLIP
jgi:hypothetical protein